MFKDSCAKGLSFQQISRQTSDLLCAARFRIIFHIGLSLVYGSRHGVIVFNVSYILGIKPKIFHANASHGVSKSNLLVASDFVGDDKKFLSAQAVIDGDTIVVYSSDVENPVAVRLGFNNIAIPNLFNVEGLPASPFRTDNW